MSKIVSKKDFYSREIFILSEEVSEDDSSDSLNSSPKSGSANKK
jgi:hypothetical protein|tara:strand:- start:51 stop:182 length:132 start_codon:yes stop_codon:yes gene_type:complete